MTSTTATDLPRLMQCIGSQFMPSLLPDTAAQDLRDEGNAAHWLAEQMFQGGDVSEGTTAPNGYIITDEMIGHVSQYVSALDCGEMEADTSYARDNWEVRGRADHLVYRVDDVSRSTTLTIDDFKYGWGIVEPRENWTLLSHAIGWVLRNDRIPDLVVLRIHQPRPFHAEGPLRSWQCTGEQLMGYYYRIAHRLSNASEELQTGPQCAKCPARHGCSVLDRAVYNAVDVAGLPFDNDLPKDVLTDQYALFERAEQMLKIGKDAREELISHRIRSGETFDGYALERRHGQRRWKTGLSGRVLSVMAGVDLTKDGLVTPAEAERRGVSKEVITALVERPMLDAKLKRIDADAKARAAFGTPTKES